MKKAIIFGNGINWNKRFEKNVEKFVIERINKHLEELNKIANLNNEMPFFNFFQAFKSYAIDVLNFASKNNVDFFDGIIQLIYDFHYDHHYFYEFEMEFNKPHFRLEDLLNSAIAEWLVDEFKINDCTNIPIEIKNMINFFDEKITLNYVKPFEGDFTLLHGSINEINPRKLRDKEKIKKLSDQQAREWAMYFQDLPYAHANIHFGNSLIKNGDNTEKFLKTTEFDDEYKEILKNYEIAAKWANVGEKPRVWQKGDHPSYDELIPKSDVFVVYAISVKNDEHLMFELISRCKKLIFVWYSKNDLNDFKKLELDRSKVQFVNSNDFISQYTKIEDETDIKFTHGNYR